MIAIRRTTMMALAAFGALAVASHAAQAQSYPDRSIRLIVPFAAGGNADLNGRVVADVAHKALGQPVYSLLGGKTRESLPLYATGNDVGWQMELGFKHFKRFSPWGPEDGIEGINRLE